MKKKKITRKIITYQISHLLTNASARQTGMRVRSDFRPSNQCVVSLNRINRTFGRISRSVSNNRSSSVTLKLYLALVKPHLDYGIQTLFSCDRKDIDSKQYRGLLIGSRGLETYCADKA